MKLDVPEILKVMLVDDWEAVTKNSQVRLAFFPSGRHQPLFAVGHITTDTNSRTTVTRV